jgi:hypothetical protein
MNLDLVAGAAAETSSIELLGAGPRAGAEKTSYASTSCSPMLGGPPVELPVVVGQELRTRPEPVHKMDRGLVFEIGNHRRLRLQRYRLLVSERRHVDHLVARFTQRPEDFLQYRDIHRGSPMVACLGRASATRSGCDDARHRDEPRAARRHTRHGSSCRLPLGVSGPAPCVSAAAAGVQLCRRRRPLDEGGAVTAKARAVRASLLTACIASRCLSSLIETGRGGG